MNKHFAIGIKGFKQSGKDTTADLLSFYLYPLPVCKISAGDMVREDICRTIDANPTKLKEQKNNPYFRFLQQEWAMMRRKENPSYWIEEGEKLIAQLKTPHVLIFPGVRMLNDAEYIRKKYDGVILHVEVAEIVGHGRQTTRVVDSSDPHITEREQLQIDWDFLVRNHGSVDDLRRECKFLSQHIKEIINKRNGKI